MDKISITPKRTYTAPRAQVRQMELEGMIASSVDGATLGTMDPNALYSEDFIISI